MLDKLPGVHAVLLERQKKKGHPKCPQCQTEAPHCQKCGGDLRGTEEKGVDTRIVADMISLAWANAHDVAVLVSADRVSVPVAEFFSAVGTYYRTTSEFSIDAGLVTAPIGVGLPT